MIPVSVTLLFIGYAMLYTGASNLLNGGKGPKFWTTIGVTTTIDVPTADSVNPNLTGQPATQAIPPLLGGGTVHV